MSKLWKQHYKKILIGGLFLVLFIWFWWGGAPDPTDVENEKSSSKVTEKVSKKASTLVFGNWEPKEFRSVLGTVESDHEVVIKSELNGTIAKILVDVGDQVKKGQILAEYKLSGDPTFINYQNALSTLQTSRMSAENSIKASEIALQNAKQELSQAQSQQGQNKNQAYENLQTKAKTTETTVSSILNFLDQKLGASKQYRYQSSFGRDEIGSRNVILKNATKHKIETLAGEFKILKSEIPLQPSFRVILYAQKRLNFAKQLKVALDNYDQLVRDTVIHQGFSEANQGSIQSQVDALRPQLNGEISSLQAQIESAKSINETIQTTILSAKNRIKSAESSLSLAKSQAKAQITGAQNQANIATSSRNNLRIKSPISGLVSEKSVTLQSQVSPGAPLLTVTNNNIEKKVSAFLSQEEWERVSESENIKIQVGNSVFESQEKFLSNSVNQSTQKIKVQFLLPLEANILNGSLVQVLVPLQAPDNAQITPLSSVSFEPDGAEILLVEAKTSIAKRKKVVIGNMVGSHIEILDGLTKGDRIVEFYKRVLPGEKIIIQ